ncbi:MAG: MCE family protein [Gammaproteobacteria bacterium]|nr:MCE family protein [Gammaproteobacteria bacterium]
MEREANYVVVGVFVLLLTTMGVLFVYWYSASRESRDYTRYEIYFDGSVFGLSEGSEVRYLGVEVGRVRSIRLDRRAADRVLVIVDIDATTPVSARTLARLSLQGVTGLLFIDLQQQQPGASYRRILDSVPGQQYPVIRSVRSDFDVFVSSLPDLATRVGELVARANALLSDRNIAAISDLMQNLDRAGAILPATTRDAAQLLSELRATAVDAREIAARLRTAMQTAGPDLASGMERLRSTADHLASAGARLDAILEENRGELRGFAHETLPEMQSLVRDARDAAREFRDLSRSLRQDPSQLLYQPPASGVPVPQ